MSPSELNATSQPLMGKLLIDTAMGSFLGDKRIRLLEAIAQHGPVNAEVTLDLPGGHHVLTAVVTDQSVERLGLAVGRPVTAISSARTAVVATSSRAARSEETRFLGVMGTPERIESWEELNAAKTGRAPCTARW